MKGAERLSTYWVFFIHMFLFSIFQVKVNSMACKRASDPAQLVAWSRKAFSSFLVYGFQFSYVDIVIIVCTIMLSIDF